MLFNSIEFLIFLPIVFAIYWLLRKHLKLQNAFVVLASYVFYGWWDWRFLILIAITSFSSWGSGLLIHKSQITNDQSPIAKLWLLLNIVINLGILAVFKYYDFFVSEFGALFGISTESLLLRIILPIGISFYTFQALSYSIDVYRGNIKPTKDIIAFFAYVAFFPQLVAGPIERATNLLPQFLQKRTFNYEQGVDGMRQILWGLYNVLLFLPLILLGKSKRYKDAPLVWKQLPQILITFVLVTIGWIIFRAPSLSDAWGYVCSTTNLSGTALTLSITQWIGIIFGLLTMIAFEWSYRNSDQAPIPHRWWIYYILIAAIWWYAPSFSTDFIYFQF